jgi:hypothetical protein
MMNSVHGAVHRALGSRPLGAGQSPIAFLSVSFFTSAQGPLPSAHLPAPGAQPKVSLP